MKIKLLFAWYDLWIGAYYDKAKFKLYILPLPMLGIVIQLPHGYYFLYPFVSLYVRAIYAYRAICRINSIKLGDDVWYNGGRFNVINGAGAPYYKITDGNHIAHVHKRLLTLDKLKYRFKFSFLSEYNFFMDYWFKIDVANRGKFMFRGNLSSIERDINKFFGYTIWRSK